MSLLLRKPDYAFIGFGSYKDNTFRIIFRNRKTKKLKSIPLEKSDIRNYKSDMKQEEKKYLIDKYYKKL